ncbi:MAG TPA: ELWxxDGT repeat protein, partial [Acidobacteriota bacterium]
MGKEHISMTVLILLCSFILLSPALTAQSQPYLVKDINAITNPNPSSEPNSFVAIGSVAYFVAYDPIHERELWRSDGTADGTWLVKDLNPGAGYSWLGYSSDLINVNGVLFFAASDPATGIELWRSDGTASGTTVVKDIFPGIESSYPGQLVNVNNVLYFTATTPTCGIAIWKSDGTENGTTLVFCGKYVQNLTHVNNSLFFTNSDEDHGTELWKMDLSTEISTLVKDIYPGIESSAPSQLTSSNGTLFFVARQQQTGKELWKSDGTEEGTVLVKDIFVGPADSMDRFPQLTDVNGIVFFGADDGINGIELWKSDGTESGTNLLKDIYPGPDGSGPRGINLSGTYVFAAQDYDTDGIWRSDGTPNGTYKLTRSYDYYQYSLAKVGNVAFFSTANYYPMTLWKTDGTGAGTMVVGYVQNISKGSFGDINGTLFFGGDDGSTGTELWKSDGTDSGTVFIKDLNPLVTDSSWINLSTNFNNKLFFSAI